MGGCVLLRALALPASCGLWITSIALQTLGRHRVRLQLLQERVGGHVAHVRLGLVTPLRSPAAAGRRWDVERDGIGPCGSSTVSCSVVMLTGSMKPAQGSGWGGDDAGRTD